MGGVPRNVRGHGVREGRGVRGRARETSPNGSARVDASSKGAWARATPSRGSRVRARASSWQLQPRVLSLFVVSAGRGSTHLFARRRVGGVHEVTRGGGGICGDECVEKVDIARSRRPGWTAGLGRGAVEGWRGSVRAPGFCCDLRRILMLVRTRLSLESVSARLSAFRHFRRRAVTCTPPANLSHRRRYGLPSLDTSTSTRARPIERPRDPGPAPPPLDSRAA